MTETDLDPASTVSVWRRLPGVVKAILVLQLGLIVYLATWMYIEYQNNQYLQAYIQNSLQTSMPALQIVLPVFLATGTITVYRKLLASKKGSTEEYSREEFTSEPPRIPTPIIPYPDEVIGPKPVRDPLPQLKTILAPKRKRTKAKGTGRTSRTSIGGHVRKKREGPMR